MSNVEGTYSVHFIKRTEQSETTLRNSAVCCLINLDHRNSQFDPMGDINLLSLIRGFSAAAGRRSGQFDRKRNFVVSYELHGIGYKVEGARRMHAI